jgi:ParB family chromosome partitioning protein
MMTKMGSKIFDKTEGIKPRERSEAFAPRIKTSPGMFLDTQHRAAKAEAENAVLRERRVRIADLKIVAGRQRQLTTDEFAELKANLSAFPLINPVTIRTLPSGEHELISGHNRVQAYVELGRTEIEANVLELGEDQVLPAAFYSNLLSPALPDYEKYLGFKQLQQATGKSQAELARESGLSKSMLSMLFAFDDLSPAAQTILSAQPHLVSATVAAKLKHLPLADEALARLAAGEITAQQALLAATARPARPAPAVAIKPVVIKQGKQRFAEVSCRGATAVIKLADAARMPALLQQIESLIRQEAARSDSTENF